jgi:hypothetical protein
MVQSIAIGKAGSRLGAIVLVSLLVFAGLVPMQSMALTQPSDGYSDYVSANTYDNFTLRSATGVLRANQTYQPGDVVLLNITTTRVQNLAKQHQLTFKDWNGGNVPGTNIGAWAQRSSKTPYSYEATITLPGAITFDWYYADFRIQDNLNAQVAAKTAIIVGKDLNGHSIKTYKDAACTVERQVFNASDMIYVEFFAGTNVNGGSIQLLDLSRDLPLNNVNFGTAPVGALQTNVGGDNTKYRFSIDLNATPGLTLNFWYSLKVTSNGGGSAFKGATQVQVKGNPSLIVASKDLAPATALEGAMDVHMMALNLTAATNTNDLLFAGVRVMKTGNSTLDGDVGLVRLVDDKDADMVYDAGTDAFLGTPQTFSSGNLTFSNLNRTIVEGTTVHLLVLFNIPPTATPERTVGLSIRNDTWFYVKAPAGVVPIPVPINSSLTKILSSPTDITKVSGDGQQGYLGKLLAPFVVEVKNALHLVVENVPITWAISNVPAGATGAALVNATALTNRSGRAVVELKLGNLPGTYNVTATSAGLVGSPMTFKVTAVKPPPVLAKIKVTPINATLDLGKVQDFNATGYEADNTAIPNLVFTWTVTPSSLGTIDKNGTFKALKNGTGVIKAVNGTKNGTANITVQRLIHQIKVTPVNTSVAAGSAVKFTAVAYDALGAAIDGIIFGWSVQNTTVASIVQTGNATGLRPGKTVVVAASGSVAGLANLTVFQTVKTITVTPGQISLEQGKNTTFSAKAYDALGNEFPGVRFAWSVNNTAIGTITPEGLFKSLAPGTTSVMAKNGTVNGTAKITVTVPPRVLTQVTLGPSDPKVAKGKTVNILATAYDQKGVAFTNATFVWSVVDPSIGEISNSGVFTGKKAGITTVKVSVTMGGVTKTASTTVKVTSTSGGKATNTAGMIAVVILVALLLVAAIILLLYKGKKDSGSSEDEEDEDKEEGSDDEEKEEPDEKGSKKEEEEPEKDEKDEEPESAEGKKKGKTGESELDEGDENEPVH